MQNCGGGECVFLAILTNTGLNLMDKSRKNIKNICFPTCKIKGCVLKVFLRMISTLKYDSPPPHVLHCLGTAKNCYLCNQMFNWDRFESKCSEYIQNWKIKSEYWRHVTHSIQIQLQMELLSSLLAFRQGLAFELCVSALLMKRWKQRLLCLWQTLAPSVLDSHRPF